MTADRYRLECWNQLAWIAARYPGPLLGTVVMANSYRHPPLLAKMAASLQVFSHGRFILGYGASWSEEEYLAYGYNFPPPKVRIAQMVDGIKAMRALWHSRPGQPATYQGEYYQVKNGLLRATARPDPADHDPGRWRALPAPGSSGARRLVAAGARANHHTAPQARRAA